MAERMTKILTGRFCQIPAKRVSKEGHVDRVIYPIPYPQGSLPSHIKEGPERREYAIYVITKHGLGIARRLRSALPQADLFVSPKQIADAPADAQEMPLPIGPTLAETFTKYHCHIHIISVGAVVRMIKDLLKDKKQDPAVVCIDDGGNFAVCLLSGHIGRGNYFTKIAAEAVGALPVITTASDIRGTLTVDILGRELGWTLNNDRNVTAGCAAVVNECRVAFIQETGEPNFWPLDKKLPTGVEYFTRPEAVDPRNFEMLLIVSDRDPTERPPSNWDSSSLRDKTVIYHPRSLVVGLGCDKDTPLEIIERGLFQILKKEGLMWQSIKEIASIDKKAKEPALLALSKKYDWPFRTFPAELLDATIGVENPSEIVKKYTGSRTVAEAASLRASGATALLLPKTAYKEADDRHNATFALARIPFQARRERQG